MTTTGVFFTLTVLSLLGIGLAQQQGKKDTICKKDNGYYPHEDYCDYYYECIDGVAYVQECPNGLAFVGKGRGLISHCDYPHRVGCPDPDNKRVLGQPARGSDPCPYKFGLFAHERSCTRYWLCWNGTGTAQQCPHSLLYSETAHACDWPDNVAGCQQHPLCAGTPNAVKAIQGQCARYWLCMGGYPRLQRCAAGLAFSTEAMRCEWAADVPGCEPEPIPEEEEEVRKPVQSPSRGQQGRRTVANDEDSNN